MTLRDSIILYSILGQTTGREGHAMFTKLEEHLKNTLSSLPKVFTIVATNKNGCIDIDSKQLDIAEKAVKTREFVL